jgi:hypothetical protein
MKAHKNDIGHLLLQHNYKFLGWQNSWHHVYFDKNHNITKDSSNINSFGYLEEEYPEYIKCRNAGHKTDEIQVNQRGSENIVSCDICKIYWKYDSSD